MLVRILRFLSVWLFWPGLALVTWGELTPQEPSLSSFYFLAWDKAQHFTAYFGLASMATMVVGLRPKLALAFLGLIVYGGAMEILQGYTGRDPEVWDFIANSIGAFGGLGAAMLLLWADRLVGSRSTH